MKNKLLATSILAGLGFAALGTANASADVIASKHVEVELKGYTYFQIRVWNQGLEYVGVQDRKYTFDIADQEFKLTARYLSDFGWKYGVIFEFKAAENDTPNVDEAYLFIDGPFGRIEMGDTDGAGPNFLQDGGAIYGIVYGGDQFSEINLGMRFTGGLGNDDQHKSGETFGVNNDFSEAIAGIKEKVKGLDGVEEAAAQTYLGGFNSLTSDAKKIVYITPTYYGFTAGVSWTPDLKAFGEGRSCDADDYNYENIVDFGLQYEVEVPEWDNFKFGMSSTFEYASNSELRELEALKIWHIGMNFLWNGFKLGAGYYNYFDTHLTAAQVTAGADSGNSFNVAGGYETGPWNFVVAYNHFSRDYNEKIKELNTWFLAGKLAYTVAPGFVVSTEAIYFDAEIAGGGIELTTFDIQEDGAVIAPITPATATRDLQKSTFNRTGADKKFENKGFIWTLNTNISF